MKEKDYLVRIQCTTFNHASYIEDAMNGFCIQKTTFPFVVVIIDDASTDGEPEVIRHYLSEHFDMQNAKLWDDDDAYFIETRHQENQNCTFVVILLKYNFYHKKAKGPLFKTWSNTKYVALCEGDDYWISSEKLQTQIDFMENNPDYSLCAHAVNYIENGFISKNDRRLDKEGDLSLQDLIVRGGDYLATASLVCRSKLLTPVLPFKKMAKVSDYPLVLQLSISGKVHYFPQIWGHYRYRTPGSWTQQQRLNGMYAHFKNEVEWLEEFNKETKYKYNAAVKCRLVLLARTLFYRGELSRKEYLSHLRLVNFFELKKEYREDYVWQIVTYKYGKIYSWLCKVKSFISNRDVTV